MKDRDNFTFLTSAPVHHVVLVMAVPTIISMLVTSIYNIVTTFYVGRISTQATAAVGIAFSVMAIIQAIGFTFGQGSGNYISRELGAQRHDNACRMASTGFFLAVGTGFVIALIGLIFLRPLALLLGSTPTILPYAETYLSFVLMAAPFMCGALMPEQPDALSGQRSLFNVRHTYGSMHQRRAGSYPYICVRHGHNRCRHIHVYG